MFCRKIQEIPMTLSINNRTQKVFFRFYRVFYFMFVKHGSNISCLFVLLLFRIERQGMKQKLGWTHWMIILNLYAFGIKHSMKFNHNGKQKPSVNYLISLIQPTNIISHFMFSIWHKMIIVVIFFNVTILSPCPTPKHTNTLSCIPID